MTVQIITSPIDVGVSEFVNEALEETGGFIISTAAYVDTIPTLVVTIEVPEEDIFEGITPLDGDSDPAEYIAWVNGRVNLPA